MLRVGSVPLELAEGRVRLDRLRCEQVILTETDDRHDLSSRLRSQPHETLMTAHANGVREHDVGASYGI